MVTAAVKHSTQISPSYGHSRAKLYQKSHYEKSKKMDFFTLFFIFARFED